MSRRQDEARVSTRARPSSRETGRDASVPGVEAAMLMLETRPKRQPWAAEVFISQM